MFKFLSTEARLNKKRAHALYLLISKASRRPIFYQEWHVPDTLDGRFELICLHMSMFFKALDQKLEKKQAYNLSQALFDEMFKAIDPALREMSVGDLSVPRHMKKMMEAFNGRREAYLSCKKGDEYKAALKKNLYATLKDEAVIEEGVAAMVEYILCSNKTLAELDKEQILNPGNAVEAVFFGTNNEMDAHDQKTA